MYVITEKVHIGNRAGRGGVEAPMETEFAVATPSGGRTAPDSLTIGLSMVNWLLLMLLMSGFLLAVTAAEHSQPTTATSGVGTHAAR